MAETHGPEFDNFIKTVRLDELCAVASSYRGGIPCSLGWHSIGGTDISNRSLLVTGTFI